MISLVSHLAFVRLPPLIGVFVGPAFAAGLEVVTPLLSPHGSAGSLAHSQADALPVLQLASLGGNAAIIFAIFLVASALAWFILHKRAWLFLLLAIAVIALVAEFGVSRLGAEQPEAETRAALIVTDRHDGTAKDWRDVWPEYAEAVESVALESDAVSVALLPEKIALLESDQVDAFLSAVSETAAKAEISVVVGATVREPGETMNRAFVVSAQGEATAYDKRHLVPGWESAFTAGSRSTTVEIAGVRYAILICKDLDFAATVRDSLSSSDAGRVGAILVPAWDFTDDARWHSRIAVVRGVENGVSVFRSAREGLLTVSDPYGRIMAEQPSSTNMTTLFAEVNGTRVATVYSRIGDAFGWAAFGFAVLALGSSFVTRRPQRS